MMENNYKKLMTYKCKDDESSRKNVLTEEITLGKRGRPSKNYVGNSFFFAETIIETFFNKVFFNKNSL